VCQVGHAQGHGSSSSSNSAGASLSCSEVCEIHELFSELVVSARQFGVESSLSVHLVPGVGEHEVTGVISSVEFSE